MNEQGARVRTQGHKCDGWGRRCVKEREVQMQWLGVQGHERKWASERVGVGTVEFKLRFAEAEHILIQICSENGTVQMCVFSVALFGCVFTHI
jgi:hypothetical protein